MWLAENIFSGVLRKKSQVIKNILTKLCIYRFVTIELFFYNYYKSKNKNSTQYNQFLTLVILSFPSEHFYIFTSALSKRCNKDGIECRKPSARTKEWDRKETRVLHCRDPQIAMNEERQISDQLIQARLDPSDIASQDAFSRLYVFFGRFSILLVINVIIQLTLA